MVKQNTGLRIKNKYSMFNTSPLRYIAIVVVHHPESSSKKDLSLQLASSLEFDSSTVNHFTQGHASPVFTKHNDGSTQ